MMSFHDAFEINKNVLMSLRNVLFYSNVIGIKKSCLYVFLLPFLRWMRKFLRKTWGFWFLVAISIKDCKNRKKCVKKLTSLVEWRQSQISMTTTVVIKFRILLWKRRNEINIKKCAAKELENEKYLICNRAKRTLWSVESLFRFNGSHICPVEGTFWIQ